MTKYCIAVLFSILCTFVAHLALDVRFLPSIRHFGFRGKDTDTVIGKTHRITVICVISLLMLTASCKVVSDNSSIINIAKCFIALFCFCGCCVTDYREHRMPNIYSVVMSVSAVILLSMGVFTGQIGALSYIVSSVFAAIACFGVLLIAYIVSKRGIGLGDIKFISSFALLTGVNMVSSVLLFSMWICATYVILLLLLKKKKKSEGVPFGPFLFVGFIITLMLSVY